MNCFLSIDGEEAKVKVQGNCEIVTTVFFTFFLRKRNASTYTHIVAGDVRLKVELAEVGCDSSFLHSSYNVCR